MILRTYKLLLYKAIRDIARKLYIDCNTIERKIAGLDPRASFRTKMDWDVIYRTNYAYGTYQAALTAKKLGIDRISVIEFGVAHGNGMVPLEEIAEAASKELGIGIDVYGFDSCEGLPDTEDYRDMPFIWKRGLYKGGIKDLKKRIKKATLVVGNVSETASEFVNKYKPAPIGFIAFDLDYYSSTMHSFKLFDAKTEYFLPRVFCYFDDCIGDDWELHCDYVGELCAIRDFNENNADKKICKINGLAQKRLIPQKWNEEMYVLHLFNSPLYNIFIRSF